VSLPAGEVLALHSDWFSTFEQGNSPLATIRSAMMSAPAAPTRVFKVAGTAPLFPGESFIIQTIFRQAPVSYDGIITESSALLTSVQGRAQRGSLQTVVAQTGSVSRPDSHTDLVRDAFTEQTSIAPFLAFEFNDADPSTRLYPAGGGIVFLKGVGSASYVAFLSNQTGTATLEQQSLDTRYFSGAPSSVPTAQSTAAVTAANYFRATLINSPSAQLSTTPTDSMYFDLMTAAGQFDSRQYSMYYYAFPPCSSCVGTTQFDLRRTIAAARRAAGVAGGPALVPATR
jgi:hypothetical protein